MLIFNVVTIICVYIIFGLLVWFTAISNKQSDSMTKADKVKQFFVLVFAYPIVAYSAKGWKK
jgi:hypothetical protein